MKKVNNYVSKADLPIDSPNKCRLQVDLFNRQKYDLYNKSIQVRYIQAQKRCNNPVREEFDCINVSKTVVSVAETTGNTTKSAHIILDYIKVNNTINNACENACEREIEIVVALPRGEKTFRRAAGEINSFFHRVSPV